MIEDGLGLSGAEAACSVHGSPAGYRAESDLSDFHELRQGFSPPNHRAARKIAPHAGAKRSSPC
ncbi:MAG: hypothetical protein ABI621_19770 [Chloroflexota bacterium]